MYKPHAVLVTIGGNDAAPQSGISSPEYRSNLVQLCTQIRDLGAEVILQTYYSADVERMQPQHGTTFLRSMDIVREVSRQRGTPLIDHHRRWERLRRGQPTTYRSLMIDPLHVNALGNMIMGLDLIRAFGATLSPALEEYCAEGLRMQHVLDQLERAQVG